PRDPTEQGPAMTTTSGPPTSTPATLTVVRASLISRLASGNGCARCRPSFVRPSACPTSTFVSRSCKLAIIAQCSLSLLSRLVFFRVRQTTRRRVTTKDAHLCREAAQLFERACDLLVFGRTSKLYVKTVLPRLAAHGATLDLE